MTFTRFPIPCRTVLAGVTAALLSTTVACGSDDGNDSADGGDTTTFSYGGVTVDIPTDPQRVVCIETRLCPEFAEITGMNLVATPEISAESAKDNVVNDELPDSVEKFEFNFNQPDPEAAANMDPDMLMTVAAWFDYYDSETQDKLEAIAPVLRISGAPDKDADWLQPLVDQAEQIGKKAEAEQSIADYNATIYRLAQTVNGGGQTVAVVSLQDDQFVLEDEDLPIEVLTDLGFTLLTAPDNREADGSLHMYSKENLNILQDADVIFVQNPDNALSNDVLWKRLPAVANGKTPQLLYNHRAGFSKVGANFAEYVAEQLG